MFFYIIQHTLEPRLSTNPKTFRNVPRARLILQSTFRLITLTLSSGVQSTPVISLVPLSAAYFKNLIGQFPNSDQRRYQVDGLAALTVVGEFHQLGIERGRGSGSSLRVRLVSVQTAGKIKVDSLGGQVSYGSRRGSLMSRPRAETPLSSSPIAFVVRSLVTSALDLSS